MTDSENKAETKKRKAPAHAFKPGQSGNPGGRPKLEPEFRERCRKTVDELVFARWKREIEEDGPSWLEAAKMLAAYGYGRPTDNVNVSGGVPIKLSLNREETTAWLDEHSEG